MAYELGIDLGTTFSAAAVWTGGAPAMVDLQYGAAVVPSVVAVTADGSFLVGEPAERRGLIQADLVAREFKRRVGDPVPYLLGSTPYDVEQLVAELLSWIATEVAARHGGERPTRVTVTHPANWRAYKRDVLASAIERAGLAPAELLPEPVAAALHHRRTEQLDAGSLAVVYDLGGGTFDAALVRSTETGSELVGEPEGIEHLGGVDFDDALFRLVDRATDGELGRLDASDPLRWAEARRVRAECTAAKVALSSDTSVSIPVLVGGRSREVRVTRDEFEALIAPFIEQTLDATARVLWASRVDVADVSAFLLVGGSSRVPLVAQSLVARFGRPVSLEAHPKHAVALGAARHAHELELAAAAPPPPVPLVAGPPAVPQPRAGADGDGEAPPGEPSGLEAAGTPLVATLVGAAPGPEDQSSAEPAPAERATTRVATAEPATAEPATAEPATAELATGELATAELATGELATAERRDSPGDAAPRTRGAAAPPEVEGGADTALVLEPGGSARGRWTRARLVGAGAIGAMALVVGLVVWAMSAAGGDDGSRLETAESTSTTLGVAVLGESVTLADAAVADANTSTAELAATSQAAAKASADIDSVGATAASVAQGAVPKQRADLVAAAQAFSARLADFQAQSATLVSDIGAVEPEVAAAVEAAEAARSSLDVARRSGQGDLDELEAEAAAARDASAALLAEVRELDQRVSALSAHVVNLTAEVGLLQRALDESPVPTTAPPATAPAQTAPPAPAPSPTAPPPTAPPPTAAPLPALSVAIGGPSCVAVGSTGYFTGTSATGVSGRWSLPAFGFVDAGWSPASPTQYATPQQVGDFQWTLVVTDAHGQTASATFTFSSRPAC